MNRSWALWPLIGSLLGCAHADYGQLADSATTAVALSQVGFAEGNPLLSGMEWPEIAAAKLVITQAVNYPALKDGACGCTRTILRRHRAPR